MIVLPSNNVFKLSDLPQREDWGGLVEIDRDFDLQAAEFLQKSDNFESSSPDPWTTESKAIPEVNLVYSSNDKEETKMDFSWTPTDSVARSETLPEPELQMEHRVISYVPQNSQTYHEILPTYIPPSDPLPTYILPSDPLPTYIPQDSLALSQDSLPSYIPTAYDNIRPPLGPPPKRQAPSPPIAAAVPPPSPPMAAAVPPPPPPPLPVQRPLSSNPLTRLKQQLNIPNIADGNLPFVSSLSLPAVPTLSQLRSSLHSSAQSPASLVRPPASPPPPQASPPQPAALSPASLLQPASPPRADTQTGSGSSGIKIPTYWGTIDTSKRTPLIVLLHDKMKQLTHFFRGLKPNVEKLPSLPRLPVDVLPSYEPSYSEPAPPSYVASGPSYSQSTPVPSYGPVSGSTVAPIVPVPTYLPINRDSRMSEGFQILVQYIAAMVGVAIVLAI